MQNLSIGEACKVRDNLAGALTEEQKRQFRPKVFNISRNPEAWGISMHLADGESPPENVLAALEGQDAANVRFYNPQLLEEGPAKTS